MTDARPTEVRVTGDAGVPVLFLPGGAESTDGFFPVILDGLLADPGIRAIEYDRPGTGSAPAGGGLRGAPDDLHARIVELGLGPVVVLAQSLGGAVALMLAQDHPDDVAGLILLDPTPVNDVALAHKTEKQGRNTVAMSRIPLVGRGVRAMLRRTARKTIARVPMEPEVEAALWRITELDFEQLGRAVDGLGEAAESFDETRLPTRPSVVVTADRKPGSPVRAAHDRAARALGATVATWPGAKHHVHLSHPDRVLEIARELIREVGAP
jgi:pimeloyl-ACP methyl ester carboxylesterase